MNNMIRTIIEMIKETETEEIEIEVIEEVKTMIIRIVGNISEAKRRFPGLMKEKMVMIHNFINILLRKTLMYGILLKIGHLKRSKTTPNQVDPLVNHLIIMYLHQDKTINIKNEMIQDKTNHKAVAQVQEVVLIKIITKMEKILKKVKVRSYYQCIPMEQVQTRS